MNNYEQLLVDLEAKRDMAHMEANEQRVKADTLDYCVIMLRNAIHREEKDKALT